MSLREAFFTVCREAKPAKEYHVSLYANAPFYGGPEEGGWWGSDTFLVASQAFPTEQAAHVAKAMADQLAIELSAEERRAGGEACLRQMEWLDARGLDADYLPEVDGDIEYFVALEDQPGSQQQRGCRHYE